MEVYIDDMLVRSVGFANHPTDLAEAFSVLRQHNMKLNLLKCSFGVSTDKFFGFKVSRHGIKANPKKKRFLLDMHPLRCKKEVQQLTGRVAALYSFISKLVECCLSFFKILQKMNNFT